MNDNKLSPVVIPTLLIHVGFLGILSLLIAFLLDDRLVSVFSTVGLWFFALLILTGLLTICYYRLNPIYYEDTTFALKAMTVLLFQLTSPVSLLIMLFTHNLLGPVFVMLFICFLAYLANITSAFAVKYYFLLLKREEPAAARWWILFIVIILNLMCCFILLQYLTFFVGASC